MIHTWNKIFILSKGLTTVLLTAPAIPPAIKCLISGVNMISIQFVFFLVVVVEGSIFVVVGSFNLMIAVVVGLLVVEVVVTTAGPLPPSDALGILQFLF